MTHTTQNLSAEQIADGWIVYTGQSIDPLAIVQVYTPGSGSEFGMAGDFDFTPPTADDYDNDPIGAANDFITKYRVLVPTRPDQSLIASLTEALEGIMKAETHSLHVGYDSGAGGGNCVYADVVRLDDEAFDRARAALASAKGANKESTNNV